MAHPVEAIPGWAALNERLEGRLVQLSRLLHHYAGVPADHKHDDGREACLSEQGCLESDIQEILREAANRVKEFREAMAAAYGAEDPPRAREAAEEHRKSLQASQSQISALMGELGQAQQELGILYQKVREYEQTIDQYNDNETPNSHVARELQTVRLELAETQQELERSVAACKQTKQELEDVTKLRQKEIGREKLQKKRDTREMLDKVQKEVMTATQQHLDREMELQEFCKKERDFHLKTIEEMMMLHTSEIKKLKSEHMAKMEECCHNHASLESEWQDKELNLQKQISAAVQDKTHYLQELFNGHVKLQALEAQLGATQTELANEKLAKSQIEGELKFAKVDITLADEKVKMGLKEQEAFLANLANIKQEAMDAKRAYNADLAALEEKAYFLQKNLSDVTNTCTFNEEELKNHKRKMEDLQTNLSDARKNLHAATMDIQGLQQEVGFLMGEIKSKDEERKKIKAQYEFQYQQLQTTILKLQMDAKQKCEDVVKKTKDTMEVQLQKQAQLHKENVQNMQKQFRIQWEEQKSGGSTFRRAPLMEGTLCK